MEDSPPLARLRAAAAEREAAGLRRTLVPRAPRDDLLDLASNDYLGLAGHPALAAAAADAAVTHGTGATGSRLVTGTTTLHAELERDLAEFTGTPALVFSSGYLANVSLVTSLAKALGDVLIVSDEHNHASLIDACRLTRAETVITPHLDADAVRKTLAARDQEHALVVTDAVFSVGGELAPLADLHAAAAEHDALLLIDEAHSFGVLGDGGRGAAEQAGIAGADAIIRSVTLSKSLASQGGAVLGHDVVIQTLIDVGRGFIFDTGLAPPSVAAARAALRLIREDPGIGERARASTRRLAALARDAGLTVTVPDAAVVSIILGDPEVAVRAREIAADHGVRVGCFRPPSVPQGGACLRLTGKATLTENDFAVVSRTLTAIRDHCRITAQAGRKTP
ncbi:MAG: 8-amino-7-oxononanoate synthase [Streptosporangiaceae bacterium]